MQLIQKTHLWLAHIQDYQDDLPYFWNLLTQDEKERAQLFKQSADEQCFILSHGMLRKMLSTFTQKLPLELSIKKNKNGKPFLEYTENSPSIAFNLSHSHEMIAIAIQTVEGMDDLIEPQIAIGVDIEQINEKIDIDNLAKEVFSQQEYGLWQSGRFDSKQLFFHLWAKKEAVIKKSGLGMQAVLQQMNVFSQRHFLEMPTWKLEGKKGIAAEPHLELTGHLLEFSDHGKCYLYSSHIMAKNTPFAFSLCSHYPISQLNLCRMG